MTLTLIPPTTSAEATEQLAQLQGIPTALDVLRRVQLVKAADLGVTQQQLAGALGRVSGRKWDLGSAVTAALDVMESGT